MIDRLEPLIKPMMGPVKEVAKTALGAVGLRDWAGRKLSRFQKMSDSPNHSNSVPVLHADEDFCRTMDETEPDYLRDFQCVGYSRGWVYGKSYGSFTHHLYATLKHFHCRRVYEIGTFKGASTLMMMNYFIRNQVDDFFIHSIDIEPQFSAYRFPARTLLRYLKHREQIYLEIGNSTERPVSSNYDLVIIDGSHKAKDVIADYHAVKNWARVILFDDLNYKGIYENAYRPLQEAGEFDEVFRVYTSDKYPSHCIALVKPRRTLS